LGGARNPTPAKSIIDDVGCTASLRDLFLHRFRHGWRAARESSKTRTASLPEHLPRETGKYPPKQIACPARGDELKHLGEDVSEILEYALARFKLIRQVRPKLACACYERIVQAEAPSRPIERSVAADCLFLWCRRVLFEEQARNHRVIARGRGGHNDLDMT